MINIIIPCTPNYGNKKIINVVTKSIDIVSQFIILYKSIKRNWNFEYDISLFHNKNIPFNQKDLDKLSKLDINIFSIEPDSEKTPYMLRCNALTYDIKNKGTHKLLLDCDMIALKNPNFDLSCDWQAMFAGSVIDRNDYEYINKKYNYNLNLNNKVKGELFKKYMTNGKYHNFFPHFNGGAFLIKEELCEKFKKYVVPSYNISHDNKVKPEIRHIGVQYGASFSLLKLSPNWKPFEKGFNYLLTSMPINSFGKGNIKLLHYCGVNGYSNALKHFKHYFTD